MKRILQSRFGVLLLAIVVFIAIAASKKGEYTVQGIVSGSVDGDSVFLVEMDGWSMQMLDTAVIKKGKFVFRGSQEEPVWRYVVCLRAGEQIGGTDFILENGKIKLTIDNAKRIGGKGTSNNELWNRYVEETEAQSVRINSYYARSSDSTYSVAEREAASKMIIQLRDQQKQFNIDFIRKNIKTGVAHILLKNYYLSYSMDQLENIQQELTEAKVNTSILQLLEKHIDAMRKTQIGHQFSDLSLKNEYGQLVKLSDHIVKNKITMIDFWASWCSPCLAEIPNLVKAYKKYKPNGFEIVGVSLDQNEGAWKQAISNFGMSWPQMSDLKGWKSTAAKAYGVQAIPFTLLVGQDGKIIAKNLHGDELDKKLAELLF